MVGFPSGQRGQTVNLFSEKGLAEFMTTGEIFELPRNSYTFPTLAERKIMLQIMISLSYTSAITHTSDNPEIVNSSSL